MAALSTDSMVIGEVERRVTASGGAFRNGDTLFARITPCLENGKTSFVQCLADDEVASGSTEFIVMRARVWSPEMVYLLARSPMLREHARQSMSGATGRQRVHEKCFETIEVAVPPVEVREQFTAIVRPMFALIQRLHDKNLNLRATRDLLLPRLMSGEIEVGEAEAAVP
jgi:type I restriction enzyme S subunit